MHSVKLVFGLIAFDNQVNMILEKCFNWFKGIVARAV